LVATKGGLGYKPTVSPWSFFISQKTAGIIPHHIIESRVIIVSNADAAGHQIEWKDDPQC